MTLTLLQSIVVSSETSVIKFKQEVKVGIPFRSQESGSKTKVRCSIALPCDKSKCKLPDCYCSGFDIPGGLPVKQVPQMVTLTFQTGVTMSVYPSYSSIFSGRTNPNKCPVSGTFFVSHKYTDYGLVHDLYAARQEIGVNSITSNNLKDATEKDWEIEMGGEAQIIAKFANVSNSSIRGMRAPALQMGRNNQLTALGSVRLSYDSTRASARYTESPELLWPYTYEYKSIQDCPSSNCPNCSFPGSWEVPLPAFRCPDGSLSATADGCLDITNQTLAYQLLLDKFNTHYNSSNRAPMVVSLGSAWMATGYKLNATKQFLDYIGKLKDVYVVSAGKVIDWVRKPTAIASLADFEPWQCKDTPNQCETQSDCQYDNNRRLVQSGSPFTYRMRSCIKQCSPCYPWIKDPSGTSC